MGSISIPIGIALFIGACVVGMFKWFVNDMKGHIEGKMSESISMLKEIKGSMDETKKDLVEHRIKVAEQFVTKEQCQQEQAKCPARLAI